MATAKANKKAAAVAMGLPECPVCLEMMTVPIFQCQSGHSLCNTCTQALCPPICPICRQNMTQMRNWQLEEIIAKAKVACPNKSSGCVYTMISLDLEEHLKECIFRAMDCPLGLVFGKCSWSGKLKDMMDHFKERHADKCNVSTDEEVELTNIDINSDDRHFFLVAQNKLLFIITVKIDTLQKMSYWAIQHIGSKKTAQQHIYEIHIVSKQDNRRKAIFIEHCFNDTLKADEVFRTAKCGMLPLNSLAHFIKDKQLSFRFFIKRMPFVPKNKDDKKNGNQGPKPPQQGPKGPGPKGSGPKANKSPKGPNANKTHS